MFGAAGGRCGRVWHAVYVCGFGLGLGCGGRVVCA